MCGVPAHASQNYLSRLINQGYKVAVAEQLETKDDQITSSKNIFETIIGIAPLIISKEITNTAGRTPIVLKIFVVPVLPEPYCLTSIPVNCILTITPI